MSTTMIRVKQDDRLPSVAATLAYSDGSAIDLTGGTVKFLMRNRAGDVIVNAAAIITDADSGGVRYDWGSGDTATTGLFYAEFEATVGGLKITVPSDNYLLVSIAEDVA